jgi:hypothetical protein
MLKNLTDALQTDLASAVLAPAMAPPPMAEDTSGLTPLNVIRTENVVSRFPVHNLSKKGKIEIQIVKRNSQGEVEIKWEVSYNDKHGQARQLAYKLDTIVINRRIEEEGRPLPKLIRLGSLREIADRLDMGGNTNVIKRALRQNASAFITVKVGYTNVDGTEKTLEADFTRYSVIFTGEKLPDKRRADCVYLNLNDVYWTMLNEAPWRPQDYDYLKALTPAAQRFYEIVSAKFYNTFRFSNLNASKIAYSEYCAYSAQQRYFDYEHFKKQMYKVHLPHKKSGYLSDVSYESMQDSDGKPDWMMRYVPGPKAKNEFEYFTGKTGVLETKIEIASIAQTSPVQLSPANETAGQSSTRKSSDETSAVEQTQQSLDLESASEQHADPELVSELYKRGIAEKQAVALLLEVRPGQDVMEQLEYADYRIASEPAGTFRNPPGFYISAVRDNIPVPENFDSSRKRKQREVSENRLAEERAISERRELELEVAFADYRRSEVEAYIALHLAPGEYAAIVEDHKRSYVAQFRNAAHWPAETLHSIAVNAAAVEISRRAPILAFEEFCRKYAD